MHVYACSRAHYLLPNGGRNDELLFGHRLCDDKFAIFSRCDIARSRLLDMVSNGFKEANDEFMNLLQGKEEPNEDEMFTLISSLKKVECFSGAHNMGQWKIWESKYYIVLTTI